MTWINDLAPRFLIRAFTDTGAAESKVQKLMEEDLTKPLSVGIILLNNTDSKLKGDDLLNFRLKGRKIEDLTFADFCTYIHPSDIQHLSTETTLKLRSVYLTTLVRCGRSVTNLPFLTEFDIRKKDAMQAIETQELGFSICEFNSRNGIDSCQLLTGDGKKIYSTKLIHYAYGTRFVELETQLGIFPLIVQFGKFNLKFDPHLPLFANIREYLKTQFEKTLEKITTGHGRGFPTDYFYNVSLIETGIFTADWECGKKIIVQFKKSKPIEHPFYLSLKANELLSAETIKWVEQPSPTL